VQVWVDGQQVRKERDEPLPKYPESPWAFYDLDKLPTPQLVDEVSLLIEDLVERDARRTRAYEQKTADQESRRRQEQEERASEQRRFLEDL